MKDEVVQELKEEMDRLIRRLIRGEVDVNYMSIIDELNRIRRLLE